VVPRLHAGRAAAGTPLACARSGDWRHPVVGLWPLALRDDLRRALLDEGLRKIEVWTARHGIAIAEWPATPVDPFFNVNTPEDAAAAERLARLEPAKCIPPRLRVGSASGASKGRKNPTLPSPKPGRDKWPPPRQFRRNRTCSTLSRTRPR
jgi:hypothetical protein